MKKLIAILGIVVATACLMSGCTPNNTQNNTDASNTSDTLNEDIQSYIADADYYGCPNSNRVKKLNIKKNKIMKV